jgi:SAM-dependent methyltransferase
MSALERRHLARLTFPEVRRALQALSSLYVERRRRLGTEAAFDGAGKRAAFALFYGPLHFITVREVVEALGVQRPPPARILDLGCGTGAAGAAWATAAGGTPFVEGVDRNPWALEEARFTLSTLRLAGSVARRGVDEARLPGREGAVVAAFTVNEMEDAGRARLLARLLEAAGAGAAVLIVEPIARRSAPWWDEWARAFAAAGGRADEWRFRPTLPDLVTRFDRAAGLDHRELTCRSLWLRPLTLARASETHEC